MTPKAVLQNREQIERTRLAGLRRWSGWVPADISKDAISDWAKSMEFGCITEIGGIVDGTLDVLLFPLGMRCPIWQRLAGSHWTDRCKLAGVEVKVERTDFQKGLKEQFSRYGKSLSGLYVAGPADVVRPSAVPIEFGVLQIKRDLDGEPKAVCRRHPRWQPSVVTLDQLWTILWRARAKMREEVLEIRREREEFLERFRKKAGRVLACAIAEARE